MTAFIFLMGVLMLLATPFACVLLFSHVRDRTSVRQRIALLILIMFIIPAGLAGLLPQLARSNYLRFVEKDHEYHAQFAKECDSLLLKHPLGTNESVFLSARDASLPSIIREWHPDNVIISQRGVEIVIGKGNRVHFFCIAWFQDEARTNVWTLQADGGEAPERTVYSLTNF